MKSFSDSLLQGIGRLSDRPGLITAFMDRIVDFLAPKAVAQAACPPANALWVIDDGCGLCCANCNGDYMSWHFYWYGTGNNELFCIVCDYC